MGHRIPMVDGHVPVQSFTEPLFVLGAPDGLQLDYQSFGKAGLVLVQEAYR